MNNTVTPIGGTGTKITVLDALMGRGKTSKVIDMLNSGDIQEPVIYITPMLDEVQRIKDACPGLDLRDPQPRQRGRTASGRSKMQHLLALVRDGHNIATTHQLFSMLGTGAVECLRDAGYTLIIDEETTCAKQYEDLFPDDIRTLTRSAMVTVDAKKRLRWNDVEWAGYKGKFDSIRTMCEIGSIVKRSDEFLVWEFPIGFLQLFKQVYVLTYLFEGSLMATYLKANAQPYEVMSLDSSRNIVPFNPTHEVKAKGKLRKLITIVDNSKMNAVGYEDNRQPLSMSWFRRDASRDSAGAKELQRNLCNFYWNVTQSTAKDAMWSSFKDFKGELKGKGYTKGWTACNLRATNEYMRRKNLAYVLNVFMNPMLVGYFRDCGVAVDEDRYALSQLVQWIFRSQIRLGKPVTLYLPSARMRQLLEDWLNEAQPLSVVIAASAA